MRPVLLRPPVFGRGLSSDFSGVLRVISWKSATEEPRRPGVVGLYLRIAMSVPYLSDSREDVDRTGRQGHNGTLGVFALPCSKLGTAGLAGLVESVNSRNLDVEDLLDSELDLGLGRAGVNLKRVLTLIDQGVALLAHDGAEDNVSGVLVPGNSVDAHYLSPLSVFEATKASSASAVKMMSSEFKTS